MLIAPNRQVPLPHVVVVLVVRRRDFLRNRSPIQALPTGRQSAESFDPSKEVQQDASKGHIA